MSLPQQPARRTRIQGEGVAAAVCAHLLRAAGVAATVEPASRPKLPAIMISAATQELMKDVLGRQDLFQGFSEIRRRIVLWGRDGADAVALPHRAVVAPEQLLLDRLYVEDPNDEGIGSAWKILASRPLPEVCLEHHFGSRLASAARANLKVGTDQETCWVESVPLGWLFLLPGSSTSGWLLSVGADPETLLGESRLIADCIESITKTGGGFPAHPRIIDPLCDASSGWLACGTAAIGFDPLCGDGTGNATREAILASAAVKAVFLEGADPEAVAAHYRTRLLAGFQRHLETCHEFYRIGGRGPWWDEQRDAVRTGLEWVAERLGGRPVFRFRLNGFTLEPIG